MTDRLRFLAAIIASPDSDAPRLIYADWLEEHGEDERAEVIRVECELAKLRATNAHQDLRFPLVLRDKEILEDRGEEWFVLTVLSGPYDLKAYPYWHYHCVWRRGFVDEITTTSDNWNRIRDEILKTTPLRYAWYYPITVQNPTPAVRCLYSQHGPTIDGERDAALSDQRRLSQEAVGTGRTTDRR